MDCACSYHRRFLTAIRMPGDDHFHVNYGKPMYGGVFGSGEFALVGHLNPCVTLPTAEYNVMHIASGTPISHRHETKSGAIQEARGNLRTIPRAHINKIISEVMADSAALQERLDAKSKAEREVLEKQRASEVASREERSKAGFVYLIRCEGRYKIGKAVDVQSRIRSMSLPSEPEIIATGAFDNPFGVERELHAKFKSCREKGEWFRLSADDVQTVIKRLTTKLEAVA